MAAPAAGATGLCASGPRAFTVAQDLPGLMATLRSPSWTGRLGACDRILALVQEHLPVTLIAQGRSLIEAHEHRGEGDVQDEVGRLLREAAMPGPAARTRDGRL